MKNKIILDSLVSVIITTKLTFVGTTDVEFSNILSYQSLCQSSSQTGAYLICKQNPKSPIKEKCMLFF